MSQEINHEEAVKAAKEEAAAKKAEETAEHTEETHPEEKPDEASENNTGDAAERQEEPAGESAEPEKASGKKEKKGKKIETALKLELEKKEKTIAELKDRYQRLMAEFENARKRNEKEAGRRYDIGACEVLEKLLPVVDNFERAMESLPDDEKDTGFAQGIGMIYKQLMDTLEGIGVKAMDPVGSEFNADYHNAVMHEENEEMGENLVAEEFQKGYLYKDQVLRHSMVKVVN